MAFIDKVDYFGLSSTTFLCKSSNDGASSSNAEAVGPDGSIVANTVYGEMKNPSCDYEQTAEWSPTIKLGAVHAVDGESFVLTSVTFSTQGGAAHTVSASGSQVEDNASVTCTYTIPSFTLPMTHHVEKMWNAWTLTGAGCYEQTAAYTISCTPSFGEKDGDRLSHDIGQGKIEIALTIIQTDTTEPSLSAATGWEITTPLSCSNPDANYPTWTATLTKYLEKDS